MVSRTEVEERVSQVLQMSLELSPDKVQPEKDIVDDLGADSLELVEIAMKLEEVFDIKVPDAEAQEMETVEDVVTLVMKKLDISE
ncbi:acyl carrier protein [Patescibacteria group bacterium]